MITIYTDGSSLGNPGPGGWAFIFGIEKKSGGEAETTNNRMEITAVIEALKYAKKHLKETKITLCTDSNLVLKTYTEHWKKKTNTDLWEELDELVDLFHITWKKVEAHKSDKLNNEVDELARTAATKISRKIPTTHEKNSSLTSGKHFTCPKCKKTSTGLLGLKQGVNHIRVDCPYCRTFIKFLSHDTAALAEAAKRPLLHDHEVETYDRALREKHIILPKAQLKSYTQKEIDAYIASHAPNHRLL